MIPLGLDQIERDAAMPVTAGVRVAQLSELDAGDFAAWERLSRHSAADNAFASHWFVRALFDHFDAKGDLRLFIAVDAIGDWFGVAALAPKRWLGRLPLAHWSGVTNPNQFIGLPLVRRGRERAFWQALLWALDWRGRGQAALYLTECPADHRVVRALDQLCEEEGRGIARLARRERAAIVPAEDPLAPRTPVSGKRRARLRSLERKLAQDFGDVACTEALGSDGIAAWIDQFLTLEAKGWKGQNGSALLSSHESAALFAAAIRGGQDDQSLRCLSLNAGGRVVAMSSFFMADGFGFGFKCCYDEAFASYAPGLLLMQRVMAIAEQDPQLFFDSCSAPDEATINGLWPGRRVMLDLCVELQAPLAGTRFFGALAARQGWSWWKRFSGSAAA